MPTTVTIEGAHKRIALSCLARCGATSVQYQTASKTDDEAIAVGIVGADFLPFEGDVVCSHQCAKYLRDNTEKRAFEVDDEELKRRQAAAAPVQGVYLREKAGRDSERSYSCARCGVKQVVQEANARQTLDALGWRKVGASLYCSRDCWGWVTDNMADTTPLVPVQAPSKTLTDQRVAEARHRENAPRNPKLEARGEPEAGAKKGSR